MSPLIELPLNQISIGKNEFFFLCINFCCEQNNVSCLFLDQPTWSLHIDLAVLFLLSLVMDELPVSATCTVVSFPSTMLVSQYLFFFFLFLTQPIFVLGGQDYLFFNFKLIKLFPK